MSMADSARHAGALDDLQRKYGRWLDHNFPNATPDQQMKGMVEELGELACASLKREQGIRGTTAEHDAAELDALGDLLIFTFGYCNTRGIRLSEALAVATNVISKRDWQANRKDGQTEGRA